MKKFYRIWLLFLGIVAFTHLSYGQLLVEDFNYGSSSGDLTAVPSESPQTNWTAFSGAGSSPVGYSTTSLTLAGYTEAGGSATFVGGSGSREDVAVTFTESPVTSGSVYASALINLTSSFTTADYFLTMRQSGGSFSGRLFALDDGSGTSFQLGISKASTSSINYYTTDLSYGTTYVVVLKYTFNSESADDDVDLFVLTALPSDEPGSPSVSYSDASSSDASNLNQFVIRQGTNTASGTIDRIRVGTSWSDLTIDADITAPSFISSYPNVQNTTVEGADLFVQLDEPGTAYYVIQTDNTTAPTAAQVKAGLDNTGTAAAASGSIAVTSANTEFSTTISGLNSATTYYLYVVAQDEYNIQSEATVIDFTTSEPTYDTDTDVQAADLPIAAIEIPSTATDESDAVDVFNFKIVDAGTSDGQPTYLTKIVIEAGDNNTADWSTYLAGAKLTSEAASVTATIGASSLTFNYSTPYSVADNSSSEFTLSVWLKTAVTDGDVLEFEIPVDRDITSDATNGSTVVAELAAALISATQTIQVTATQLVVSIPASAQPGVSFSVTATATDANDNTDLFDRTISLAKASGDGSLTSANGLSAMAMTGGSYTWSDLQLDATGDYTFTVTDDADETITGTSDILSVSTTVTQIEDFTNFPETSSSYATGTFVGNDGSTWSYSFASGNTDVSIDSPSPVLGKDKSPAASMTSGTITDGIGTISFDYMQAYSTNVSLELYINDVLITTVTSSSESGVVKNSGDISVDVAGDVVISLVQPAGAGQVTIDNITWTSFTAGSPLITIDQTDFDGDFGTLTVNEVSTSRAYSVIGSDLTEDITITAPDGFSVSLDNTTFSSSVTLTQESGAVASTSVYVRFAPTEVTAYSGTILHTSTDANSKTLTVTGAGLSESTIYYEDFSTCPSSEMVIYSVASTADWECSTSGNPNNSMEVNGYGADVASDDWLITPAIDLTDAESATLTFESWTEYTDATYPPISVLVSQDYAGSGDPTVATWTSLSATFAEENSETWTSSNDLDLTAYLGGSVYVAFRYISTGVGSSTSSEWRVDNILLEERAAEVSPSISLVTSSFSDDFDTLTVGDTSAVSTYTISGSALTADITITAPTGFEISSDGTSFGTSLTLSNTDGAVDATTISVRFRPTAEGSFSGSILHESTDATSVEISVSGTAVGEAVLPYLTVDTTDFDGNFGELEIGTSSDATTFTLSAYELDEDVIVTVSEGFEITLDEDFSEVYNSESPLTISKDIFENPSDTVIYARFAPTETGTFSGKITIISAPYDDVVISVSGNTPEIALGLADSKISVYPNPVKNYLQVANVKNEELYFELITLTGKSYKLTPTVNNLLDISQFASGLYILNVTDSSGKKVLVEKLIKE